MGNCFQTSVCYDKAGFKIIQGSFKAELLTCLCACSGSGGGGGA